MKFPTRAACERQRPLRLACMGGAVLLALSATALQSQAQTVSRGMAREAQAQYRADVQHCNSGRSTQPRALCLHEAREAYDEARRGVLEGTIGGGNARVGSSSPDALRGCDTLAPDAQRACREHMGAAGRSGAGMGGAPQGGSGR